MTVIIDGTAGITFPVTAGGTSAVQASSGKVLQVVQTVKTDTFSTTNNSFTDVTGLSVSITPTSASNKILVMCDIGLSCQNGSSTMTRLVRGSSAIYIGDSASNRPLAMSQIDGGGNNQYNVVRVPGIYLDSPATTSSVTYKIQIYNSSGSGASTINKTQQDRDTTLYDIRAASSITVMEIAA